MNQRDFDLVLELTTRATAGLLRAKGAEYAGSADRLANFKRGAQLTGATPLQVAFIYASKHYDSIATYIRNDAKGLTQHLSEPIEGRFDDLINYCILMKAIIMEAGMQPKEVPLPTAWQAEAQELREKEALVQRTAREFLSSDVEAVAQMTGSRRRWDNEARQPGELT